jgi:hypothetical protein
MIERTTPPGIDNWHRGLLFKVAQPQQGLISKVVGLQRAICDCTVPRLSSEPLADKDDRSPKILTYIVLLISSKNVREPYRHRFI